MIRINKLTQKLGAWFNKDSGESESPLLLQSLEDRVLYSAVPLPVDNVEAPVENTDLDDVQFIEIEANTTLPIGEAIAEDASSQFLAQDSYSAEFAAESADATLEDLEELVNSFDQSDVVSSENDEPRTAMGLATATPDVSGGGFFTLEEGQSFTIDFDFLGNSSGSPLLEFGQGFYLTQEPTSGEILVNGTPLESNGQLVTRQEIRDGEVIFVPDTDFVGNVDFRLEGFFGIFADNFSILYEGVADDGVSVFGDTFAPVDGSAPAFETTTLQSETHVASLSDGGYVVVASLGDSAGQLQFQMFDDAGVASGSEVVISANEFRVAHVNVVGLDDGGFLVAFEGEDATGPHLNIQRFDANGQSVNFNGSQLQLTPVGNSTADDISLEYLGEDRFIVSYILSSSTDIKSIVASLDGVGEELFDTSVVQASNDNRSIQTALLSDGGYVLARVEDDGSTNSIFASIFDPGSHLQQQDIQLAIDISGSDVAIVATPDNGFAVVWQGTSSDPTGIYAARFDRLGNAVGSPTFIADGASAVSASADVIALDDGSFVVSYTAVDLDGTQEIIGQRLNADLTGLGDAFTINSFSGEDQTDAEIALLADGTFVATFKSGDQVTPATIFHQRLQMSVAGDEDTWIPLNSVIGIDPSSSTEVFETIELAGLPVGSKIHAGQLDGNGDLIVQEVFAGNPVLTFNPADIGQLEFMAPADASGTIEATATLTTNDGMSKETTTTEFQVIVNPVIDAPSNTTTSLVTDEDTALTMTQAEFIENFIDIEGAAPDDLVNSISNVPFDESDFEDRIRDLPSSTSGISSPYIFDGATPLTATLPVIGQSASFEFWIRSEDFSGNDRVIAQFGDANQGFTIIQRQDEVVFQFKSASSEIVELSAEGLSGLQRSGSYDQIVVTFGTAAGDANELDAAIFLNGNLAESITDVKSIQVGDVIQIAGTLNLGQSGSAGGVGASAADNFGGELGLLRFENEMLDNDEVKQRYDEINNAPRIISINGQDLDSRETIYFTTQENYIQSTLDVLPNGDFQFTPQPDFDQLTPADVETATLEVVIQRGAETFDTVTELAVTGVNDAPIQQFEEVTFNRNGGLGIVSLNDFVVDPDGTLANPTLPPVNMVLTTSINGADIFNDVSGFRLEIDPLQFPGADTIVLQVGVTDANNGQTIQYDLIVNLVDKFEISGVVANDSGLDGSIDGDSGFALVDVYLYRATNGLTDIVSQTFVANTQTDASGRFLFDQNLDFDQEYFVVVDSLSVLNDQSDRDLVWAQQTFATEGAVFSGDSGLELTQDAGYLIGGKESEITDGFWESGDVDDSQHIIAVSSSGNLFPLNELGFGFNFDIVNVVDNSDQVNASTSGLDGQGTLNQFIHNANNLAGSNRMFFVPTTAENASNASGDQWWQIEIDELLPTISDDGTVINGRVFETSDSGLVGTYTGFDPIPGGLDGTMVGVAGDRIGESDALLNTTSAPALEITRKLVDDAGADLPDLEYGIRVRGDVDNFDVQGVEIRNIAINGFGTDDSGDSNRNRQSGNIVIDGGDTADGIYNVSNFTLENNVIGTDPYFTAVPEEHNKGNNIVVISAEGSEIVTDSVLGLSRYSNQIQENVIGYADFRGIYLTSGNLSTEDSDATSRWLIQSNQVSFNGLAQSNNGDGISLRLNTDNILVQENYINGNHAVGIDTYQSAGGNEILRNTIENNRPQDGGTATEAGGIRLFGIGNTVYGNSISDNAGAGVHVTGSFPDNGFSTPPSFHNQILSNEFSNNDGISIDLSRPLNDGGDEANPADYVEMELQLGDGIDINDGVLDEFTGNGGLDSPEIASAKYDGSRLTVSFNSLETDFDPQDRIQIYLTENGVSHGEGSVLLGEVLATDLVNVGGMLEAEIFPPSDRLPLDLTQEININATLTSFAQATVSNDSGASVFEGYQTSEFSSSQLLEVNHPNTVFVTTSVDEGQTTVISLPVGALDSNTITYSIVQGRDGAKFAIDNTGLLTFLVAPDFEAPNDTDADNQYEVLVRATDDSGAMAEFGLIISVIDVNEAPELSSDTTLSVSENATTVETFAGVDIDDGDTLTYSLVGADAGLFTIDSSTGEVTFTTAPDFETRLDADGDNFYEITVVATDNGTLTDNQDVRVEVTDANEVPELSPDTTVPVSENTTAVGTFAGVDPDDGDVLTYSLVGVDAVLFTINSSTGEVAFTTAPDFEMRLDADGNNIYEITVVATDDGTGALTDSQDVSVKVFNANDAPELSPDTTVPVTENTTAVGTFAGVDIDGDTLTYSLIGADAGLFTINSSTGEVTFTTAPDLETPLDADGDNFYEITVNATDNGTGLLTDNQNVRVEVTDVNEVPELSPDTTVSVDENTTAVGTFAGVDPDDGDVLTYSLVGVDAVLFTINSSTGEVTFATAPDFETSLDAGGDNFYEITVIATDDGTGLLTDRQDVRVEVTDANGAPVLSPDTTVSVAENTTAVGTFGGVDPDDGDTLTYSLEGADAGLFTIDSSTGEVTFTTAPDFETRLDADGDNFYEITVVATDNGTAPMTDSQNVSVEVTDANEVPELSPGTTVPVTENTTAVGTFAGVDPDDGDTLTYSLVGADAGLFTIDSSTGEVTFTTAPDFETPLDADGDNFYEITVVATDNGTLTDNQDVRVEVITANEVPVFVGNNQQLLLDQDESSTETFDLLELFSDQEDQSMTLDIVGGANADLFHIVNNELTLIDAPELIGPQSPIYEVQIVVNDGVNDSITKTVNLMINNINDAPEADDNSYPGSQDELDANASFGVPVDDRFDADGDSTHLVFAGNGADNSLFEIVNDRVQFIDPPVWENGGQNSYVVTTALNDGTENSEIITFEITVDNINDRPEIIDIAPVVDSPEVFQLSLVGPGTLVADLNQATTFDKDGDPVSFSLDSVGQDNNLFFIDGNNKLRFASTPQLEGAAQKDFNVSVVVSDGQLNSTPQAISITVQDDNVVNPVDIASVDNPLPQGPAETLITVTTDDNSDVSSNVDALSEPKTFQQKEPLNQTPQRRSDINGITAVSDLKIGDDDLFSDLTSDSVSYLYQFDAQGPQLVTQEIGDIMESRHTAVDMRLEESMLANYFWQGFEDSEDEFIRKNLEADTTTIVAASAGLSLGLVSWLRLTAMATTVVTQLPAWKTLDVAPLISAFDEDEAETIHQIVDA